MRAVIGLAMLSLLSGCARGGGGNNEKKQVELCRRMQRLCGSGDPDKCTTTDFWKTAQKAGEAAVATFVKCIESADSCKDVTGCLDDLSGGVLGQLGVEPPDQPGSTGGGERPTVEFASVKAQAGSSGLSVEVELVVTSDMPAVAPDVKLLATCNGASDDDLMFTRDLSDARRGERKVDIAQLFANQALGASARCDLIATLVGGATPPARFCFQNGATSKGACP